MNMSPRPLAYVITLGTRNIPLLRDFYRQLGWPLISDDENFVVFELRGAV